MQRQKRSSNSIERKWQGMCRKCNGRKFRLKEGKWVRCKCLRKQKLTSQYIQARIPSVFHTKTWTKLKKSYSESIEGIDRVKYTADKVASRQRARSIIITGDESVTFSAAHLFLKAVIDGGLSAYSVTVRELMDAEFNKEDRALLGPAFSCDVLFLRMACPPLTNNSRQYASHGVEKLCLHRKTNKLFTFYSSMMGKTHIESEFGKPLSSLLHESPIIVRI